MVTDASQPPGHATTAAETLPSDEDTARTYAAGFAGLVQAEITQSLQADAPFAPQTWILARRDPFKLELYPAGDYGLIAVRLVEFFSDDDMEGQFAWIRKVAVHCAAVGVAVALKVRLQAISEQLGSAPGGGAQDLVGGREVVFLNVEHRVFPHPRRRVAIRQEGDGNRSVAWVDLDQVSTPIFARNREPVPSFLPPVD